MPNVHLCIRDRLIYSSNDSKNRNVFSVSDVKWFFAGKKRSAVLGHWGIWLVSRFARFVTFKLQGRIEPYVNPNIWLSTAQRIVAPS